MEDKRKPIKRKSKILFSRVIVALAIILVILLLIAQFLLPRLYESKIESKLNHTFNPSQSQILVESSPSIKLLWGRVDSVKGSFKNITLKSGLKVDDTQIEIKNISFSPWQALTGKEFNPNSIAAGQVDFNISEASVNQFLKDKVKGLDKIEVSFQKDSMDMKGHFNIGGIIEGEATTSGPLELKENQLTYAPQKFSINGFGINTINMPSMNNIVLYNFNSFPLKIEANKIETNSGKIHLVASIKGK